MAPNIFAKLKDKFKKEIDEEKRLARQSWASAQTTHTSYTTQSAAPLAENGGRHNDLEFGRMNIGVSLMRGPDELKPAHIAFARLLSPDKTHLPGIVTSYSFELFLSEIEIQINKLYPNKPVETKHGFFSYISKDGYDRPNINDQISFEVALNHLYHKRHESEVIDLMFMPESDEARGSRLKQEEQAKKDREEDDRFLQQGDDEVDALFAESERREAESKYRDSDIWLTEPVKAVPKSGSIVFGSPNSVTTEGQRSDTASPRSQGYSSNTSQSDGRGSKLGLSPVVKKQASKTKARETAEDRRERLKSLWEESERVLYKKWGDGEFEDETVDEIIAREKDDEDEGSVIMFDEEEGEDDETTQEDIAVIKLRKLLNMPELTQLQDPSHPEDPLLRWKSCCAMFRIDPDNTGIDELVTVAGLKTKIYQYQAFGIYWQMKTSRKYGGGFVADDMGLGKTLSFLAYMVVERQLTVMWEKVIKSREVMDGVHLQENEKSRAAVCRARQLPGWIACPCSDLSPTSFMAPKPGLRMACVPAALVRSWWGQWKTHVDTTVTELGFNIIVDHKGAFDHKTPSLDIQNKSDNPRLNMRAAAERYRGKGRKEDTAKSYQDGFLLLTTKETYPIWVQKHHTYEGEVRVVTGDTETWKKGKRVGLVFGIAMIDESHEEPFKNMGRAKTLIDLPHTNQPFIWGYSGTPFSQLPRSIEGVLWAIEKNTQSNRERHENYPEFSNDRLDEICKKFNTIKNLKNWDGAAIENVLEEYKPFLRRFMLRRDANTRWFGHPLIKLKPHVHQDITLRQKNPPYTAKDIADFEAGFRSEKDELLAKLQETFDKQPDARRGNARPTTLTFNRLCRAEWRSSLLATFPWLLKLAGPEPATPMALTELEVLMMRGSDRKENESGYAKNLKSIVEKSAKALWLLEFIHTLEPQRDVNGEEEKLIVITQFPQVAFILKLFLQRYLPDQKERVGLVTGRMPLKEKSDVINAFTGKDKGDSKMDIKILIGTIRMLGVGLQLTRSCNLVLMEPDHHFARELQAYARVHRIGQQNPLSFSYRLIDGASEIEQRILKRQADRRESPGRKLSPDEQTRFLFGAQVEDETTAAGR